MAEIKDIQVGDTVSYLNRDWTVVAISWQEPPGSLLLNRINYQDQMESVELTCKSIKLIKLKED